MMKSLLAAAATMAATLAQAHAGHGQDATHWHATDAWGFVMIAAAVAAALFWMRRDK